METDFDFTTVGTAFLILGLAYLLSGLVFLLPSPENSRGEAEGRERDEEQR
jgi:hypothetical protein